MSAVGTRHTDPPTATERRQVHDIGRRRAWAVWAAAVSVYMLAVAYRTSLGVAGLAATERFGVSAAQLASFTVLQLALYAALQLPVGVLLDRFGSRRMLLVGLTLMALGQTGFAVSASYSAGLASRALIGAGDAMIFVSILRLVGVWFPARRVPLLSQLTMQMGMVGSIAATVPLTQALARLGWTDTFLASVAVAGVSAAALLTLVKDSPWSGTPQEAIRMREAAAAVRETWALPGTRMGAWTHFTTSFGPGVFGLLWGYPFLVKGEGLDPTLAGWLLIAMTGASAVAGPLIGRFTARRPIHRADLVLGIVGAISAAWVVLLAWPGPAPLGVIVTVLLITAVGGPGSGVAFDMARAFNPQERIGKALSIVSIGGFTAMLAAMGLIGAILDHRAPSGPQTYTLTDFRVAMSVQFAFWAFGAVQIRRYRSQTKALLTDHHPEAWHALRRGELLLPGISARR
jgi:predicted MFS family arabinose efflux permease